MKENTELKINGKIIEAKYFAFDDCHKIYLIETDKDLREAKESNYTILPIEKVKDAYENSCPLKFINSWKLESIVEQGKEAIFETAIKENTE